LDLGLTLSPLPRTPGTSSTAIPGPARFLAVPADQGRQRVLADLEAWIEDESFA
jgi:hypothetical protein